MNQPITPTQYPDAGHYADIGITPELDADPVTPLAKLAKEFPVVSGRNGVFEGVAVPNNFLLPDQDQDLYLALSFEAARQVCRDNETWSSEKAFEKTLIPAQGRVMITLDEPEHNRYKKLVMPSFSHRMVNEGIRTFAKPIIDKAIDAFAEQGEVELISTFTSPFTYEIIAGLFGLPLGFADAISKLSSEFLLMGEDPERALAARAKLEAMYQQVIDDHKANPADNLLTMLINTELEGNRLTDEEIRLFLSIIVGAAQDTTTRQLASLITLLLENPDQFEKLRQDPSLISQAVWESIRICPAAGAVGRISLKDTEICGVKIPAGSGIYAVFYSANCDESKWKDPLKFDITRPKQAVMTFSAGVHSCLGQSLAIAEMELAMESILEKLPNLRKDEDRWHKVKIRGFTFRSPTQLPVKWDV